MKNKNTTLTTFLEQRKVYVITKKNLKRFMYFWSVITLVTMSILLPPIINERRNRLEIWVKDDSICSTIEIGFNNYSISHQDGKDLIEKQIWKYQLVSEWVIEVLPNKTGCSMIQRITTNQNIVIYQYNPSK